jgi:hypothetical protein
VADAARSGPASALVYRFDVSTTATFGTILVTGTVSETLDQTSFTPPSQTPQPPQAALFWRAMAIDPVNLIASPASVVQSFTYVNPPSVAAVLAAQEGAVLWSGIQPPGRTGHAVLGDNWQVGRKIAHNGTPFLSPPLEELQAFDLLDRGLDPQAAIDWMHANGYPSSAAYYPLGSGVIGFPFQYMALDSGRWDLVDKIE